MPIDSLVRGNEAFPSLLFGRFGQLISPVPPATGTFEFDKRVTYFLVQDRPFSGSETETQSTKKKPFRTEARKGW
jgi:hypothetical protein